MFACGDAAAVPDPTRPGQICAMTAQHAQRQGKLAARNIAASYDQGVKKPYKHHELGWVVDLGGKDAAANPLNVSLAGLPAISVPCGFTPDRLPCGLQFTGRAMDEATLLRVADAFERAAMFARERPDIG